MTWFHIRVRIRDINLFQLCMRDMNLYLSSHSWYEYVSIFTCVIRICIWVRTCDISRYSMAHAQYESVFESACMICIHIRVSIHDTISYSSSHAWSEFIFEFTFVRYKFIFESAFLYKSISKFVLVIWICIRVRIRGMNMFPYSHAWYEFAFKFALVT